MKQLFNYADKYIKQSTWKDFALLKFCLFAMGILVGIQIPEKNKKHTGIIAAVIFTATYIPLMAKFISVIRKQDTIEAEDDSSPVSF
mgnify:CR=1 FL=1